MRRCAKKKLSKREILNRVADVLFTRETPQDAIELSEICIMSGISEQEALMAINYFINDEINIRLTDEFPRKLYCGPVRQADFEITEENQE